MASKHRRGTKPPNEPGRPLFPIDWTKVASLCATGCSGASIAHELGCSPETLYLRTQKEHGMEFSAFKGLHYERGNDLIRAKQFDLAVNAGNERLLIFLGKNRLGQRDRVEMTGAGGEPLPAVVVQVLPPSTDARGK